MPGLKPLILMSVVFILAIAAAGQGLRPDKWAKYDGGRVHYYDTGGHSKKALILVHGWTCNAEFWNSSYAEFPGYRVIAVDLPGHGKSDKPKTSYSMEYMARSLAAVMKRAKIKDAVFVGHSMGTVVIRQFYRLFPEQTLGLVIVDGPLRPYGTKAQMEPFLGPLRSNYKETGPKMIDGLLGPVKDDTLKKRIREAMLATPDYVAISAMDGMADDTIWGNDQIMVPVLAVMNADGQWPKNVEEIYKGIAPDLEFHLWTGVSHFLMMERPAEFNQTVKSFLEKTKLFDNTFRKVEVIVAPQNPAKKD